MSRLEEALGEIAAALTMAGASSCLVGGIAVSARIEPRFTRDLDLAISVADDAGAEALIHTLVRGGYRTIATVEQDAVGRLATARMKPPREVDEGGVVVDLLFASSGIEPEIVAAADLVEVFPACAVHVARVGHLVALKLLSRDDELRPQDAVDLRALLPAVDEEEEQLARDAIRAIVERGYSRGRALEAELERLLSRRR